MSRRDDLRLDKRFSDLLRQVRPYALRLQHLDDSKLCRLWLDRLAKAEEQRNLRNEYLLELYKQLKDRKKHLRPPFNKPPESGKLMPLSKLQRLILSSSCNELADSSLRSPCVTELQSDNQKGCSWIKERSKSLARRDYRARSFIPRRCDSSSPARSPENDFLSPDLCEQDNRNLLRKYKERVETLSTIVEDLEDQNVKLQQKLELYQNSGASEDVPKFHVRIKQLTAEIDSLKCELANVNDIKENLMSKHNEIVERCKAQMTEQLKSLKEQLNDAQGENKELYEKISSIEGKLRELTRENEIVKSSGKELATNMENLKMHYEKIVREKEEEIKMRDELVQKKDMQLCKKINEVKTLLEKVNNLELELDSKSQEDTKLQSLVSEQYSAIKKELARMRDNIESTSMKQEENHYNKISNLTKNVEKLTKHTRKLRDNYYRRIYHLIKENDKVVNNLQAKLKAKYNGTTKPIVQMDTYYETDTEPASAFKRNYNKFFENIVKTANNQRDKYYEKLSYLDSKIGCHLH